MADMVTLGCAVYGDASVFSVEIERNATVAALREAIYHKKRFDQPNTFPASALRLFLARKKASESKWLKDDDDTESFLRGAVDAEFEEMLSSWALDDGACLGPDFQPQAKDIHVLVALPPSAAVRVTSDSQASEAMVLTWFELVDAAGVTMTDLDGVSIDTATVTMLRDAVKTKYADSLLAGIAPTDLVVYTSRAAFDAKRAPLEFDHPINSLGESPNDPLIVQVPPSKIPTMKRKWFQLVDAAGVPLADVDGVNIDSPIVVVLRDAVKTKYANSILAGIAPTDLVVYANRAAMEAKSPLDEDVSIDSLGESDEDPLIAQATLAETSSVRAASGFQSVQELVEASLRKVLDEREKKRSVYSLSNLNSELGRRIKRKMRLIDDYLDLDEPVDTSVAGYDWIPEVAKSENCQRAGYLAYLQQHLKPLLDRGNFQLDDIALDKTALSVVDPRLPFRMNGTADVLLVSRRTKVIPDRLAGIRFVIELKKQVEYSDFAKALGQLVSCSLKAPLHCYPVSLLTDLNACWHFSWFNEESVVTHVTLESPKNAVDFIIAAAIERDGSVPFQVPFIPRPLKRLRVDDFLPMPSDGAYEMMERYELMADELEPDFLTERLIEYMQHLVQTMPAYAHMYT